MFPSVRGAIRNRRKLGMVTETATVMGMATGTKRHRLKPETEMVTGMEMGMEIQIPSHHGRHATRSSIPAPTTATTTNAFTSLFWRTGSTYLLFSASRSMIHWVMEATGLNANTTPMRCVELGFFAGQSRAFQTRSTVRMLCAALISATKTHSAKTGRCANLR